MLFSVQQIEQVMKIIDFQHLFFSIHNIGTDFLSSEDKNLLKEFGIDMNKIELPEYTPFQQAFYFGRLAAALKDQTDKIDYNDFLQYLRRGQFIPLNKIERNALKLLENRAVSYVNKNADRIKQDVQTMFDERNSKWQMNQEFKDFLKEKQKEIISEKRSKSDLVRELGRKTKSWQKDLGRIAETEMQNVYQYGALMSYLDQDGENVQLYKEVFRGACKYCIKLYLSKGIGSEPLIFSFSELLANGTNIGRKAENWLATIGPIHPFCRCELRKKTKGDIWNKDKEMFVLPEMKKRAEEIKGKIVITVGDKKFEV